MKKTIFTILWVFLFFIVSQVIVGILIYGICYFLMPNGLQTYDPMPETEKVFSIIKVIMVAGWGIPIIGLILCLCGKLPGTHQTSK
jgi:hypothetical protein